MAKGGFKVLVNGRVKRCCKIEVDFDEATVSFCNGEPEHFDRETFAISTETSETAKEIGCQESHKMSKIEKHKENWELEFDKKFMPLIPESGHTGLEPLTGITGNLFTIKEFIRALLDEAEKEQVEEIERRIKCKVL